MLDGITIDPVAFTIPIGNGFPIHWYGIIVTLGIAIGAWWAGTEVKRRGGSVDDFYNGLLIVVISGFVFARAWYVIQESIAGDGAQFNSLGAVVNVRAGGLNILGGFVGATLVALIWVRWKKLDFWMYADVAGPALLIAQSFGRWGNFINQELYGPPTELPWGLLIDASNRIAPYNDLVTYPETIRFHPTFLYESLWLFIGFILLIVLNNRYRDRWRSGTLFGLFMIWWGGGRAWVELFRPDQPKIGDSIVSYSMVFAALLAVAGLLVLLSRYDKLPTRDSRRRRKRVHKPKPKREADPETKAPE
jgi:phosphatidylglycerol:prolipoprotein diacylglycerol transferase